MIHSPSSILTRLLSPERAGHDVHKLLSHFTPELEALVGNTLEASGADQNAALKILEECYEQSFSDSGDLHIDNYFIPLYEAASFHLTIRTLRVGSITDTRNASRQITVTPKRRDRVNRRNRKRSSSIGRGSSELGLSIGFD